MAITPDDLVRREVCYCVSSLVSTLSQGYGMRQESADLTSLVDQAFELACPIADYESAAIEAGFYDYTGADEKIYVIRTFFEGEILDEPQEASDWEDACAIAHIEPHDREVFEHWIVSDWLADKLAEHGEKVDKDFAGLTVWARTTTGQGIASDSVIEAICAELNT